MSHSPASFPHTEGASQKDVLTPWKTFSVFFFFGIWGLWWVDLLKNIIISILVYYEKNKTLEA